MVARLISGLLLGAILQAAPKQVAIVNATLHQYEDGPAVPASFSFLAGETVFFSFQIGAYQVSEEKVQLSYSIDVLDPQGVKLVETTRSKIATEVSYEDKAWLPKVRHSFQVPPSAGSGVYRIQASVKDEISSTEAKKESTFEVHGFAVEPSQTLIVRNFRFLRSEEDKNPLASPAAYRPGGAVWARFEIIGYKLGEKNRLSVEYGISVLRPTGEVLYSEPNATADKDESFYPKRWVQGILSLKLDPDIAPGEYTIVVTVRDEVGGQTFEERQKFRIE